MNVALRFFASDKVQAYEDRYVAHFLSEKGDLKGAEAKFKESIAILERLEPEGSLMVATLTDYAETLKKENRSVEARNISQRAGRIASKPISPAPEP